MERSLRINVASGVRTLLVLFMLFMFILSMIGCDPLKESTGTANVQTLEIQSEKRILKEGITFMLRNIDYNLEKLDREQNSSVVHSRKQELLKNRMHLIELMKQVKGANSENWAVVSASARESLDSFSFLSGSASNAVAN